MSLDDRLAALRAACCDETDPASWSALAVLASRMEVEGRGRNDPIRLVVRLLGDRWSKLIMLTLSTGAWRHAALRRVVGAPSIEGAISQRVLTMKLRALEREGLVIRTIGDDVPPRVGYRLTAMGTDLLECATAMLRWIGDHHPAIILNRRRFAGRQDD